MEERIHLNWERSGKMSGLKKEESFTVDGVAIAAPSTYKPVFATTSTKSSKRDQELSIIRR